MCAAAREEPTNVTVLLTVKLLTLKMIDARRPRAKRIIRNSPERGNESVALSSRGTGSLQRAHDATMLKLSLPSLPGEGGGGQTEQPWTNENEMSSEIVASLLESARAREREREKE